MYNSELGDNRQSQVLTYSCTARYHMPSIVELSFSYWLCCKKCCEDSKNKLAPLYTALFFKVNFNILTRQDFCHQFKAPSLHSIPCRQHLVHLERGTVLISKWFVLQFHCTSLLSEGVCVCNYISKTLMFKKLSMCECIHGNLVTIDAFNLTIHKPARFSSLACNWNWNPNKCCQWEQV